LTAYRPVRCTHPLAILRSGSPTRSRKPLRRRRSRRPVQRPRSSRAPPAPEPSFVGAVHAATRRLSRWRTPAAGSYRQPTHLRSIHPRTNHHPRRRHWTRRRPMRRLARHLRLTDRRSSRRHCRSSQCRATHRRARHHRLTHRRPTRRFARSHRSTHRGSCGRRSPSRPRSIHRLAPRVEPPLCRTDCASRGQPCAPVVRGAADDRVASASLAIAGGEGSPPSPWSPAWAAGRLAAPPAACPSPAAGSARSGAPSATRGSGQRPRRPPPSSRRWPNGCGCGGGGRRDRRPRPA
jgi:hypothetical protein